MLGGSWKTLIVAYFNEFMLLRFYEEWMKWNWWMNYQRLLFDFLILIFQIYRIKPTIWINCEHCTRLTLVHIKSLDLSNEFKPVWLNRKKSNINRWKLLASIKKSFRRFVKISQLLLNAQVEWGIAVGKSDLDASRIAFYDRHCCSKWQRLLCR